MTTIAQLAQLISQSVSTIEKTCATNGTKVPDLDSLFTPDSEAFRFDPAVAEAVNIASAAASQLTAILQPPTVSLCQVAAGVRIFVICLRCSIDSRLSICTALQINSTQGFVANQYGRDSS